MSDRMWLGPLLLMADGCLVAVVGTNNDMCEGERRRLTSDDRLVMPDDDQRRRLRIRPRGARAGARDRTRGGHNRGRAGPHWNGGGGGQALSVCACRADTEGRGNGERPVIESRLRGLEGGRELALAVILCYSNED